MCTAATYQSAGFYFGRTLDYEVSYGNQIVITPRNYALRFRHTEDQPHHYAIIGMGLVAEDYPLYYDAMNEKGLCMAGLNFVGNAAYSAPGHDKENVAQFEFIPWLLGQCANLAEAKEKLQNLQLTDTLFNTAMPRAQLHWLIAVKSKLIVLDFGLITAKESQEYIDQMKSVYNKFKNRGVEIYMVCLDKNKLLWEDVIKTNKINWICVWDEGALQSRAASTWNVKSVPANYIINQKKEIVGKNLYGSRLEDRLNDLLKK